jgi:hypothetical protein
MQYRRKYRRPVSRAFAEHLPDDIPSLPAVSAYQASPNPSASVVQRYEDVGDNTLMSDNRKFAVQNDGTPNSKMYVSDFSKLHQLNNDVVEFVQGPEGEGQLQGMQQVMPINTLSDKDIKDINCGEFARKSVNPQKPSSNENDNAPKGSNLYAGDLEWGMKEGRNKGEQRGMWGIHYAPVIMKDGSDRGTYETAVFVDHASFRIYGSKRGQTFRYKTVKSDIELAFQHDRIDEKTKKAFLAALNKFVKDGSTQTKDPLLTNELRTILALEKIELDYRVDKKKELERELDKDGIASRKLERDRRVLAHRRNKKIMTLLGGSLLLDMVAGFVTGAWTTAGIGFLIIAMLMGLVLWMHVQSQK